MNPQLLRVTNRIIERSRETRSAYLGRIEQAKTSTVHRSQLACGNLAHGFAACQPEDKASLKRARDARGRWNLPIIIPRRFAFCILFLQILRHTDPVK